MKEIHPVVDCLWSSSYCALKIAQLLPETDLTEELFNILMEQCELIDGVIDEKYFLIQDLEKFSNKCHKIISQVERIELNR